MPCQRTFSGESRFIGDDALAATTICCLKGDRSLEPFSEGSERFKELIDTGRVKLMSSGEFEESRHPNKKHFCEGSKLIFSNRKKEVDWDGGLRSTVADLCLAQMVWEKKIGNSPQRQNELMAIYLQNNW